MDTFDYVVVGAGAAGCVLTNRLSEDNLTSVVYMKRVGMIDIDLFPPLRGS